MLYSPDSSRLVFYYLQMRKGGTQVSVAYHESPIRSFIHSYTQQMLAVLPVSSLVSGPMKSQVDELMWASSASLESDRNEQIAERTNGRWGRAGITHPAGRLSTVPSLPAWQAMQTCPGRGRPFLAMQPSLNNLPSWALIFSSVNWDC